MSQKSLGLIETYGLLAAVEAADAAVKSANVRLIGYEQAKGSGMTTIKVEGDVGAVKAAVSAAQAAAAKVGRVASVKVIARPSTGLEHMVRNQDTVGYQVPESSTPVSPQPSNDGDRKVPTPEQSSEQKSGAEASKQDAPPKNASKDKKAQDTGKQKNQPPKQEDKKDQKS